MQCQGHVKENFNALYYLYIYKTFIFNVILYYKIYTEKSCLRLVNIANNKNINSNNYLSMIWLNWNILVSVNVNIMNVSACMARLGNVYLLTLVNINN